MAELIEREALIEGRVSNDPVVIAAMCAPSIDAVPVVHGRWLICSDGYYPYCSACKAEPKSGCMSRFCPSCGAKMDGGETP